MYILIAILLGLIIGFIRRGSIGSIFEHKYKKWYLGLIGLVILVFLHYSYLFSGTIGSFIAYLPILSFIGYLFLLLMFLFNLEDIFSILIAIGITLNFIVIFINGGFMPVAQSVIDIMPANAPLTISIQDGVNATYSIIQTDSTLLSMLGIILPIPFEENILTLFGDVPGLCIGTLFILVGLIGVTQGAMVLNKGKKKVIKQSPKEPVKETVQEAKVVEEKPKVNPAPRPESSKFDSRTEELFFEENPLPKDPLDKIFKDEPEQTRRVTTIREIKYETTGGDDNFNIDDEIDMLTKPIGTGIIDTGQIKEKLKNQNVKSENNGFFTSEYIKGKEKEETVEIAPEEVLQAEPVEEKPEAKTEPVTVEVEPVSEEVVEETPVIEEEKKEPEEIEEKTEAEEETVQEKKETTNILDLNQLNLFIDSVQDENLKQSLIDKITEVFSSQPGYTEKTAVIEKEEPVEPEVEEEVQTSEPEVEIEEPAEPEVKETSRESEEKQSEEVKFTTNFIPDEISTKTEKEETSVIELPGETEELEPVVETEPEEIKEEAPTEEVIELSGPQEEIEELQESVTEETVISPEEEEETETAQESSEETTALQTTQEILPVEVKEQKKPVKFIFTSTAEEEMTREIPKLADITKELDENVSSEEENSDTIKVPEKISNQESAQEEEQVMTIDETTQEEDIQEENLPQSELILDENIEGVDQELLEALDLDLIGEITSGEQVVSTKRGEFIQDEGSGYFVNKAYKEEKANMDRSEEEMLNVWAQVSRQEQDRKKSRRRQASMNYQTSNPYQEEIERQRIEQEEQTRLVQQRYQEALNEKENAKNAYIDKTQEVVNAGAAKDVKDMTDKEREAAGYKRVEINMNGKTLSFWQKKN